MRFNEDLGVIIGSIICLMIGVLMFSLIGAAYGMLPKPFNYLVSGGAISVIAYQFIMFFIKSKEYARKEEEDAAARIAIREKMAKEAEEDLQREIEFDHNYSLQEMTEPDDQDVLDYDAENITSNSFGAYSSRFSY